MATPHNEAKKEDISKNVIMPGDPMRAKYIAEHYLKDYKLVNKVRGMYAYTGYYKDKKITVMAHGMGMPSVGIYTYELFNCYDVEQIIRIGTVGACSSKIPLRSVILAEKAYSKSNFAKCQNGEERCVLSANDTLNKEIDNIARNKNIRLKKGIVYSSDVFYGKLDDPEKLFSDYGCLGVEMESFALFHTANIFKKKAACLLTVSNNLITGEELTSIDRETSFNEMIELALEASI